MCRKNTGWQKNRDPSFSDKRLGWLIVRCCCNAHEALLFSFPHPAYIFSFFPRCQDKVWNKVCLNFLGKKKKKLIFRVVERCQTCYGYLRTSPIHYEASIKMIYHTWKNCPNWFTSSYNLGINLNFT